MTSWELYLKLQFKFLNGVSLVLASHMSDRVNSSTGDQNFIPKDLGAGTDRASFYQPDARA